MKQQTTTKGKRLNLSKKVHLYPATVQQKNLRKKHVKIKVLVTIPEKLYQNGIISLLKESKDVIIRETESGWLGTPMIAEKFKPHVIIMSLKTPPAIRSIFLSVIRKNLPGTKILLICDQKNDEEVIQALSEGASGYVLTQAGKTDLLKAVKGVANGDIWAPRYLMGNILESFRSNNVSSFQLSFMDNKIALLLSDGLTDKEIAQQSNISHLTVRDHLNRIYRFLGVSSRSRAIVRLLQTK